MRIIALLAICAVVATGTAVPPLDELLRRTGKSVEEFWNQFSAVNCVEQVSQQKLAKNDKVVYRQDSSFDYLVILQLAGGELSVEESRVPIKAAADRKELPLLTTNGFSTLLFIFHPHFQGGFEYGQPETEAVDGRTLLRVRFRQIRGARSPSALRLRQRHYPLEWEGTAWIDPDSASVVRVTAKLGVSMADIGLKSLNADVRYAVTRFSEDPAVHWLPSSATIEAETLRQRWRNIHCFTGYKHFSVKTTSETQTPGEQ